MSAEEKKESTSLLSVDAQRIMDAEAAFAALRNARMELAALKLKHEIARTIGIKGEHSQTLYNEVEKQTRLVEALTEYAQKVEDVPEGSVYSPTDLTIVKGTP